MIVDLFLVYQFIRRLATPFESWDAFKLGIIDAEGNILKKRKDLTTMAEKKAWGWFDLMLLKMKRLINKIPGGEGAKKLASYAAALWLIKEHNMFTDQATLTESASLSDSEVELMIQEFSRCYLDYTTSPATVNQINELFDNPYKITWSGDAKHRKGKFLSDAGQITISFEDKGTHYLLSFEDQNGSMSATDEGDQYRILTTVLHGAGEFMAEYKPKVVKFSAEKRPRLVVAAPAKGKKKPVQTYKVSEARIKIYTRMTQKFAAQAGYDFKIENNSFDSMFVLTRKDGLKEEMSAGGGAVAGIGVGPDGEPGMSKANQKKHRQKNAGSVLRRKIAEELVKRQADPLKDHGIRKTVKRPKKPAEPIA